MSKIDHTLPIPPLSELALHEKTVSILEEKGIKALFPIQYHTLDDIIEGVDIIAKDKTGSGKTLAYALPLTERLRKNRDQDADIANPGATRKPKVLVMVPTRELAIQVFNEFELLSHDHQDHLTAAFYGGVSITEQIRKAKNQGFDVLVATPGRLIDHIERGSIDLSAIESVVLDETDEMLDMGFKDAILKILKEIKTKSSKDKVQFLLFSATVPPWVNDAAREFMKNPKFINLASEQQVVIPKDIKHVLVKLSTFNEIMPSLSSIVDTYAGIDGQTIIFTNTKRDADEIVRGRYLRTPTKALHGDIQQMERESILKCLVATNVAARGLDFPAVDLVIQINPPNDIESYVHRSGRTGRAGKKGTNVLMYSGSEAETLVQGLKRATKLNFEVVNSFMLQELKVKSEDNFKRYVFNSMRTLTEEQVSANDSLVEQLITEHGEKEALRRLVSYVVMNPLERRDLREKSKFSSGSSKDFENDSRSFSRGSRNNDFESGYEKRGNGYESGYDRRSNSNPFSEVQPRRTLRDRDQDMSADAPADLTKSVFVGNVTSTTQVDSLKEYMNDNGFSTTVAYVRAPSETGAGFMFLTPGSASEYTAIVQLRKLQLEDSFLFFSPRKQNPTN
jgi:superfamily II DNA/RNA helicase